MITVISPAKKLSEECFAHKADHSQPAFLNKSSELVNQLKKLRTSSTSELDGYQ